MRPRIETHGTAILDYPLTLLWAIDKVGIVELKLVEDAGVAEPDFANKPQLVRICLVLSGSPQGRQPGCNRGRSLEYLIGRGGDIEPIDMNAMPIYFRPSCVSARRNAVADADKAIIHETGVFSFAP